VWNECRVNEPVDPKLFEMKLPADAQRTNALVYR
jgi:hypothetical protein